jgi:hypothetical protein
MRVDPLLSTVVMLLGGFATATYGYWAWWPEVGRILVTTVAAVFWLGFVIALLMLLPSPKTNRGEDDGTV